jgi:integrase
VIAHYWLRPTINSADRHHRQLHLQQQRRAGSCSDQAAARNAAAGDVGGIGVHTLRRSAAVDWLESGVHIKAVADLLGHSSIAITGDIYGHTSDDTARAAVDGWSGVLGL